MMNHACFVFICCPVVRQTTTVFKYKCKTFEDSITFLWERHNHNDHLTFAVTLWITGTLPQDSSIPEVLRDSFHSFWPKNLHKNCEQSHISTTFYQTPFMCHLFVHLSDLLLHRKVLATKRCFFVFFDTWISFETIKYEGYKFLLTPRVFHVFGIWNPQPITLHFRLASYHPNMA